MAAAAYKVNMVVRGKTRADTYYLTASDVNLEYWLFPSGDSSVVLNANPCYITDIMLSAAGTDTSRVELFINGVSTGKIFLNATLLTTAVSRGVQQSPIFVPAGAQIKFKQLT